LRTGPGYAPEVRQAPSLQVNAPLNVQTGPSGAEQVAQALGLVSKVASPILQDKIKRDAFDRTSAGQNAAVLNKVDAKREAEDNLYARGVKFATKERSVRNALAEVDRKIAETGADMAPEQRAQARDEMLKSLLGDMVNDPESAGIAAKLVEPWQTRNRAADNLEVIKEAQDETMRAEAENIKDGMTDGTFNYATSVARLAPVIGREAAVETVIDSVGAAAVNLRDERLIDTVLPESVTLADGQVIDGPRKSQKHQAKLDQYRELAHKARLEDLSQVRREDKQVFEKDWISNPLNFTEQHYDAFTKQVDSLFSEDELNSYWRARNAELERMQNGTETQSLRALYPGLRLRQLEGRLASDGKPVTPTELQQIANSEIERAAFLTGRAPQDVASEYTAIEGYVYQPMANDLQMAPPSDTELWGAATEQYFKLSPKVRELYVPDGNKRALYERTQSLLGSGKKPAEVGEMLNRQDDKAIKANLDAVETLFNKKVAKIGRRELSDGGWFGASTSVGNIANSKAISFEIKKRARERVGAGADPETAVAAATKEVVDTYVLVPGPSRDKSILLPRTREITDGFDKTVEWFYSQLPVWLEANGYDQKAGDVRLTTMPGSDQNTILTLVDRDGMVLDMGIAWSPRDLENERTRVTNNKAYEAVATAHRNRAQRERDRILSDSKFPRVRW